MIDVNSNKLVKTSYTEEDVVLLLKDLTPFMKEIDTREREALIQSGIHYSEMLPMEHQPSKDYIDLYNKICREQIDELAYLIAKLSEKLILIHGEKLVLISLARAGLPVGVLIKRYLKKKYGLNIPHYGISIIRDKGIDENAMEYIYSKHGKQSGVLHFQFVDGWTGKGTISSVLNKSIESLEEKDVKWRGLNRELAVIADPASITNICGTHRDFLMPSACLNSTVSGLVSRTILNKYIGKDDFHGAVYFSKFESIDKTYEFIDKVDLELEKLIDIEIADSKEYEESTLGGLYVVKSIGDTYGISDYGKIKPGIGETTRVLLRRVPWKVLINKKLDDNYSEIEHIIWLCKDKNVPIESVDLGNYAVCGIIKDLSADA